MAWQVDEISIIIIIIIILVIAWQVDDIIISLLFLLLLVRGSTDFSDFTAPDSCAMMQRLPGKQVTDAEDDIIL